MKRIIAISALMITTMGVFAQSPVVNPFPKTITVNGSAEMEIVPDEIYVQVELKEYEKKGSAKMDLEKDQIRIPAEGEERWHSRFPGYDRQL